MRMLILAVLLFVPLTANAVDCELEPSVCQTTAGCYLDGNANCRECPGSTTEDPQGYYCEAGAQQPTPCPAPFTYSTAGTQGEGDCYRPCSGDSDNPDYTTINCGETKLNADSGITATTCKNAQDQLNSYTYSEDYHLESGVGCYLNTRPCKNFTTQDKDGETSLDETKNRGDAIWNEGGGYDISACRHVPDEVDDQLTHCTRRTFYKPYPHNVSTVSNAQGILHFYVGNVTDTGNYEKYFCVNCGSASYYPDENKPTNIHHCEAPGTNFYKACQCHQISQGNYSLTGTTWNNSQPIPSPAYAPCPAGQTTDAPESTSSTDCHYTEQTEFCDAKGCFTLSTTELSAWGLTN